MMIIDVNKTSVYNAVPFLNDLRSPHSKKPWTIGIFQLRNSTSEGANWKNDIPFFVTLHGTSKVHAFSITILANPLKKNKHELNKTSLFPSKIHVCMGYKPGMIGIDWLLFMGFHAGKYIQILSARVFFAKNSTFVKKTSGLVIL